MAGLWENPHLLSEDTISFVPKSAMKLHRLLVLAASCILAAAPAFAGLIGATVTGTLNFSGVGPNYFDPAIGAVPAGNLNSSPGTNTVVISGSATEFGFQALSFVTADFSDTQLVISSYYGSPSTYAPWMMTFSSSAFTGQSLSLVSQTFAPGLTASLVGNLITINWEGGQVLNPLGIPSIMQGTYNIGAAGVPDGGSAGLLFAGALLTLATGFRRLKFAR